MSPLTTHDVNFPLNLPELLPEVAPLDCYVRDSIVHLTWA